VKEIKKRHSHEGILLSFISVDLTIGRNYRLKQAYDVYRGCIFISNIIFSDAFPTIGDYYNSPWNLSRLIVR